MIKDGYYVLPNGRSGPWGRRGDVIRYEGDQMGLFIKFARSHGSDDYADVIGPDGKAILVHYRDIEWMQLDGSLIHENNIFRFPPNGDPNVRE